MVVSGARISLPIAALAGFSESTRNEVLRYSGLMGGDNIALSADGGRAPTAASTEGEESGPPEFTVAMARKLIDQPINEKTTAVLRAIAEGGTPNFRLRDIVVATPGAKSSADLRGAWSGITRRARNILGDPEADFVWWAEGEAVFENKIYKDQSGRVAALTHQSLRKAFGIRSDD
jgi:hypothetical protein